MGLKLLGWIQAKVPLKVNYPKVEYSWTGFIKDTNTNQKVGSNAI